MNPISGLTPDGRAVQGDTDVVALEGVVRGRFAPQSDAELAIAADQVALAEGRRSDHSVAADRVVLRPARQADPRSGESDDLEPADDVVVRSDRQAELWFRCVDGAPFEN